jgi:hypothetical protein
MQSENPPRKPFWSFVLVLTGATAIAYLPFISRFGYINDDWYLMYDAHAQGPQFFHVIFSGDRPGRADLMGPLFSIFGLNPLYYNLSAYLFRLMGGLCLFWTLSMLWPRRHSSAALAAILFSVYPGFLSQPNAIDYQSHIFALFMALLSVALSVKSILARARFARVVLAVSSIFCGWAYLGQIEYFIGLEVFRFACLFLISNGALRPFWKGFWKALRVWIPFAVVPIGFLLWHTLFFASSRRATDVSFQLGQLFASPLTGLWWLVYLIQDMLNVVVVAWGFPLYTLAFQMRLRDMLVGMGLAALVILLAAIGLRWGKEDSEMEFGSGPGWARDNICLGLTGLVGGLTPVILANRHVIFPDYSRYTLISAIGMAVLVVVIIANFSSRGFRVATASLLLASAVLTHYANGAKAAAESDALRNFWWQVAWRAPSIKADTTLVANYPLGSIQEDYFVWGPANLIYYPEKQDTVPVQIRLPAAVLNDAAVLQILAGRGNEVQVRRGNQVLRDYKNVLVMTQSTAETCVRLMDGSSPELSSLDPHVIMLSASSSHLDDVIVQGNSPTPSPLVFGPEPAHGWCYYYEKASLARQQGDWAQVARLGEEALSKGYYPADGIEWLPFLQAYVVVGDRDKLHSRASIMSADPFLKQQTCRILTVAARDNEMRNFVQSTFCD